MQFETIYTWKGKVYHRVTTIERYWGDQKETIGVHFDQDAAAAFLAKLSGHKFLTEGKTNIMQWLDNTLVKLCEQFGNYIQGDSRSFILPETMNLLPQSIYHLRKNPIIRNQGISVDEVYCP